MSKSTYLKPEYFYNRELSWLSFDYRILGEAQDKTIPLLDRLKFLSITASNLDEFYMVRVASLKDMVHAEYDKKDIAGMTPAKQLEEIGKVTHEFMNDQYRTYNNSLIPALKKEGIAILSHYEDLSQKQAKFVDNYFKSEVYPVLTPMAFDSSRPFPLIRNKTLNIAALLKKKNEKEAELEFAMVQVPSVIPRIVELPEEKDENGETQRVVILLEEIIERNMQSLFLNYDIVASHPFRIMRNADFSLDEEEAVDLLEEIQKQLKKRQWGEAIRLEIESNVDKQLLKILSSSTGPVSGGTLSQELHVSRQIIVQDISLLRANGATIFSTNKGYLLQEDRKYSRVFKVYHTDDQVEEELSAIVDAGGQIRDVFVYHKVYGVLKADMGIKSRRDIRA